MELLKKENFSTALWEQIEIENNLILKTKELIENIPTSIKEIEKYEIAILNNGEGDFLKISRECNFAKLKIMGYHNAGLISTIPTSDASGSEARKEVVKNQNGDIMKVLGFTGNDLDYNKMGLSYIDNIGWVYL